MAAGRLLLLLASLAAAAKPLPEPPRDWVHNEGVISAKAEGQVSGRLRRFHEATGHQMVVALFGSLDGESLEDYSNKLFRSWRIGDAKRNDGVLFALFKADRRWRVEVGYGLEARLTDLEASLLAGQAASARLKRGDYDDAVQSVVEALASKLSGPAAPRAALPPPPPDSSLPGGLTTGEFILIVVLVAAILLFLFLLVVWGLGSAAGKSGGAWTSSGWSSGGSVDWGSSSSGGDSGGFSGGGGSSGGGGASGSW